MKVRPSPWLFLLLILLISAGAIGTARWMRLRNGVTPAELAAHMPSKVSVRLFVDVAALREARILEALAGSPAEQDADYRRFVEQSGFDYQRDLETLLAGSDGEKRYFLLGGRFDWKLLTSFAVSNGGICKNAFCRVPGSTPNKHISFFPLRTSVLALAIGPDAWLANDMVDPKGQRPLPAVADPFWIAASGVAFASGEWVPPGAEPYLRILGQAKRVVLSASLIPTGDTEVRLRAECDGAESATRLRNDLERLTIGLRDALKTDTRSAPELGRLLSAGQFGVEGGVTVTGRWPVSRSLFQPALSPRGGF